MSTQPLPLPVTMAGHRTSFLPAFAGFFFAFRLFIVLLTVRVVGADAKAGTALALFLNYALFVAVVFAAFGPDIARRPSTWHSRSYRWVLLFCSFSFCSLAWTAAASVPAAIAFWAAMAADTAIVVLLLRSGDECDTINSFFHGYVYAATATAVIAWLMPTQSDLRLGDEELLGPNQIGYLCAFAVFLAQYLIACGNRRMKYLAIFLAITLLRSFSKTTIVAFIAAQAFLLVRDTLLSRRAKFTIVTATACVLAAFSSIIGAYFTVYTNAGNSPETLTGRLGIWIYFLTEGLQHPWIGHGFHSVWNVVPLFGVFEARHAHNEILQQFYVYGLCGVVMLIGLYGSLFHQLKRLAPGALRTLGMAFLLFALVRGFADTEAFDLSLPIWLISLIGITAARNEPDSEAIS